MNQLSVKESPIPGLYVIDLEVHGDTRGWFKENYQKEKMEALGLSAFEIVQNNFSFNAEVGASRGLHAEPWEKYVSLANGRVFCAWVDLRKGDSFGKTFSIELTPDKAIFVPRGVANGYQTLEPNVTYTYLVNAHYSPDVKYNAVHMYDPNLSINWPIKETEAIMSDKDKNNPRLKDVTTLEF
jgi:dTDP-4-dehydrorhamnose 3,5-epimerase